MVVALKDGPTPLPGQTITWSTDNGSMTSFSTTTDANGEARNTVTPSAGGAVNVTASFAAVAAYTASSTSFTHNATIASVASLSTDEVAVAEALDSACAELQGAGSLTPEEQDLLNQCLALGTAAPVQVADALEEMLPDVAEAQAQTGQTAVNAQFDNLKGRMAALRNGATSASLGGLTLVGPGGSVSLFGLMQSLLQEEAPPAEDAGFSRWGLFASGSIGRGENEPGDNVPSYDYDINGITVGIDYRKTDNLVIGAAVGYTRQDTDLANNEGSVEMRGMSLSGYASWYLKDSWYVDGSLTLGRNRFDNRRRIVYTLPGSTVDTQARAEFDGSDRSLSVSFGRDFNKGAWGGGLYGRMNYSRLGFDEFEEEIAAGPGSGLGLRVESRSVTALASVLGGRLTYTHSADWGVVVPLAQVEWQKEHKSDPELFRAFLIDDPTGTPILVTGEPLDSSFFRVGVGLSLVLTRGRSGFVLYEKMLARDGMEFDNLTLGFRMEF
jgi:outer membrane autotransporter protein